MIDVEYVGGPFCGESEPYHGAVPNTTSRACRRNPALRHEYTRRRSAQRMWFQYLGEQWCPTTWHDGEGRED